MTIFHQLAMDFKSTTILLVAVLVFSPVSNFFLPFKILKQIVLRLRFQNDKKLRNTLLIASFLLGSKTQSFKKIILTNMSWSSREKTAGSCACSRLTIS